MTTPADLDERLGRIRDLLRDVRRETIELSREYTRLSPSDLATDTIGDPITPEDALKATLDGLDAFDGALALADDAANIAQQYTSRLSFE